MVEYNNIELQEPWELDIEDVHAHFCTPICAVKVWSTDTKYVIGRLEGGKDKFGT